ncbi:TSUP family transporter [Psychromonas sp. KJ10-10]|uniref:TSUP family transporter n=1 Tax=Psychromonas sp. KJ10-10 TaxID=3391823 RepID=UPI0039B5E037
MEIPLYNLTDNILLLLFLIAIIAGIVDAIAGGGGLITVPSLLLAGIPPFVALGTNKLQAVIGEATSFVTFLLYHQINIQGLLLGMLATAIGAILGAYSVSLFDEQSLRFLLPILMVFITLYSIFSKSMKKPKATPPRISVKVFMICCGLSIGFYNGFFGPGTGSIWMIAFVILLGYTIKQSSIATKPLNLMGNFVSLLFFVALGAVDYSLGIVMGAGQIIGSIIGSKMVIKNGDKIVRPIFISVTLIMTCKLIYEMPLSSLTEFENILLVFIN